MGEHPHWNWQQTDWPCFRYERAKLESLEGEFLRRSGIFVGATMHVAEDDKQQLVVDLIADEALETSEIEGEILSRDSLQSSIRRQFGLVTDNRQIAPAEGRHRRDDGSPLPRVRRSPHRPASFRVAPAADERQADLPDIGQYRTGDHPMQVVSGPLHEPKVHFEAPPSRLIPGEMNRFLEWFRDIGPGRNIHAPDSHPCRYRPSLFRVDSPV